MGVHVGLGTMPGGLTPICEDCGVCLCWDISEEEYLRNKAFWDAWCCEECNGARMRRPAQAHGEDGDWRIAREAGDGESGEEDWDEWNGRGP